MGGSRGQRWLSPGLLGEPVSSAAVAWLPLRCGPGLVVAPAGLARGLVVAPAGLLPGWRVGDARELISTLTATAGCCCFAPCLRLGSRPGGPLRVCFGGAEEGMVVLQEGRAWRPNVFPAVSPR